MSKSFTAPSTPQAESINFPVDARISNSIVGESITADLLDVRPDTELPSDHLSSEETPAV